MGLCYIIGSQTNGGRGVPWTTSLSYSVKVLVMYLKCATIQSLFFHHSLLKNNLLSHVELKVFIFRLFIGQLLLPNLVSFEGSNWLLKAKIFFEQHQSTAAHLDRLSRWKKKQSIQRIWRVLSSRFNFCLNEVHSHDNRKIVLTTQLLTYYSVIKAYRSLVQCKCKLRGLFAANQGGGNSYTF